MNKGIVSVNAVIADKHNKVFKRGEVVLEKDFTNWKELVKEGRIQEVGGIEEIKDIEDPMDSDNDLSNMRKAELQDKLQEKYPELEIKDTWTKQELIDKLSD
jgi:hypothetical protein